MTKPNKGGRPCTVCNHPNREAIDRALILKSMPVSRIADRYGVGEDALRRHLNNPAHITQEMRRQIIHDAKIERERAVAESLTDERIEIDHGLRRIVLEIEELLRKAKANDDDAYALASLREMRKTLMDLAKVHGQLNGELTLNVNLNQSPQFIRLRDIILSVLNRHSDAKADFLSEMQALQIAHGR